MSTNKHPILFYNFINLINIVVLRTIHSKNAKQNTKVISIYIENKVGREENKLKYL